MVKYGIMRFMPNMYDAVIEMCDTKEEAESHCNAFRETASKWKNYNTEFAVCKIEYERR